VRFFKRSEKRAQEEYEAARRMSQEVVARQTLWVARRYGFEANLGEDGFPDEKTRALASARLEEMGEEPIVVDEVSRGIRNTFWTDAEWASTFLGYVDRETLEETQEGLRSIFNRPGTRIKIIQIYNSEPSLLHPLILQEAERLLTPFPLRGQLVD